MQISSFQTSNLRTIPGHLVMTVPPHHTLLLRRPASRSPEHHATGTTITPRESTQDLRVQ